jgi:hypothetical protein
MRGAPARILRAFYWRVNGRAILAAGKDLSFTKPRFAVSSVVYGRGSRRQNMNSAMDIELLEKTDQVMSIGHDFIPDVEKKIRNIISEIFVTRLLQGAEKESHEMLSEAIFWSLCELINNANKANNRWAMLRRALHQRIKKDHPEMEDEKIYADVDYAIENSQTDMLQKYNLQNLDLTMTILKMIEMHHLNSFALSEKFNKKIDVTLRIKKKGERRYLLMNVINNSAITVIDKKRVEYNLDKVKEDLISAGNNPFEAAVQLYDKAADQIGGGFGAGLRSIVLFLKEGYKPFSVDIVYSRLIQYRSAGDNTIFSIELPIP